MQVLFILLILPSIIFSSKLFSKSHLYKKNQNFCVNCKFYMPNNFLFGFGGKEFGKCKLYYEIKEDTNFLVTGNKKKETIEYYYCSTCRNSENMCGKQGLQFMNKNS